MFPDYLADVAQEMARKSAAIRRDFASHRPSAGENRQDLVSDFLKDVLPERLGVGTGLIFSSSGMLSRQADVVIVDALNNAPLHPDSSNKLWPVEAVYALIEIKTHLHPADIDDAIEKGRRFKSLTRDFADGLYPQPKIEDSLFIIWAFESPDPTTVKENLLQALSAVPIEEQPDFVVVPHRLVAQAGQHRELSRLGQPTSEHRRRLEAQYGQDLSRVPGEPLKVYDLGEHSLMAWYIWCDSWLRMAGPRLANPLSYLPSDKTWGRVV